MRWFNIPIRPRPTNPQVDSLHAFEARPRLATDDAEPRAWQLFRSFGLQTERPSRVSALILVLEAKHIDVWKRKMQREQKTGQ